MASEQETAPSSPTGDIRSAEEMIRRVIIDPTQLAAIKSDPLPALQRLAQEVVKDVPPQRPLDTDPLVYRMVVAALGVTVLVAAVGVIVLAALGKPVPETLTALGSGAIGALGGLLAPSPIRK